MKFGSQHLVGGCVRGAAHIQQEKPCQDALLLRADEGGRYAIACAADGHGSSHCPYSGEGAAAAVQIAAALLAALLDANAKPGEAYAILEAQKDIWLPKQLESQWKERIQEIHNRQGRGEPFSYELYGTTLLALAVTDEFVFAAQLGDGDMLAVGPGASVRRLFPAASGGSETYSLCLAQSWQYVQATLIPLRPDQTAARLFWLSTDGYANSFTEEAGFLQAGADMYALWQAHGADYLRAQLPDWLEESSRVGSGDDITVGLVLYE